MTSMSLRIARLVAILSTGLAAGVYLGHQLGVSLAVTRLPASSFVQLQQIVHSRFVVLMPVLLVGAMCALIAWTALLAARRRTIEFWLAACALFALVAVSVITRTINSPINEQLMTWSAAAPPADLLALWRPWEQMHSIRTVLTIAAFSFQLIATSGRRDA